MDGAADAALGAWASIRGFFTPATLFLVVNLVIGTIALTSRSHQRRRRQHQEPPFPHQQENEYYDQQLHQEYVPEPEPAPAPLARTSSVLDRLRSIGLYRFRSGDFPPEYAAATDARDTMIAPEPAGGDAQYARSRSEPAPMREERRRPAPSRMRKSSSEARKAEVPPVPAARVVHVRAPVLEEDDDFVEEEYARADEFRDNSFATQEQPPPAQHEIEEEHYCREEYVPPLRPAPSVLERLRSFGLYRYRSGDFPPEYAAGTDSRGGIAPAPAGGDAYHARSRSEPAPAREGKKSPAVSRTKRSSSSVARKAEVAPAPAARLVHAAVLEEDDDVEEEYARADEFTDNFATQPPPPRALQLEEEQEEQYYREEYFPPPKPAPLARAPSVLERLRSFGLYRFRSGDVAADDAAAAVAELERNQTQKQATQYSRSRSEPSREQSKKGKKQQEQTAEAKMSKSSSEARKPAPEEAEAEEGGVDARADDFINTFRKQLQLQRLNSLLNYKEMLNRGA